MLARFSTICVSVFLACAVVTSTAAASVIAPAAAAAVEGNSNNCIPFTCGGDPYQQLYAPSLFPGDTVILGMSFRPDATFAAVFTATYSNVVIQLGTTAVAPDSGGSGLIVGLG